MLQGADVSIAATRLRIQTFVNQPDYTDFVAAIEGAGFATQVLEEVTSIEFVDFSSLPVLSSGRDSSDAASADAASLSPTQERLFANVAAYILRHLPGIREISSSTWDISMDNRCLATYLVKAYSRQLRVWNVGLMDSGIVASGIVAGWPVFSNQLTVLQVETRHLQLLGAASMPAAQLQTLKFIDFAKDNVANDMHRHDAMRSGKNLRVTMGTDTRQILFPKLRTLSVRRVPYTYTDAWSMFLDSPLKSMYVAGKHAHVRYIDLRLLANLNTLDIHLYLTERAQGRFTAFIKTMLTAESMVKSAWLRHSGTFPVSVPDVLGWQNVRELNVTAYVPPITLLTLVSQMPQLSRLIVQRIACDASETVLEETTFVELGYLKPKSIGSSSVCELQLHMVGEGLHSSTLQSICYMLLSMPRVHRLAIKHGYWPWIRKFGQMHLESNPGIAEIELVHHISMQAKSAMHF
ncbi:hypothetical protein LPJ66_000405 [Kickxella alabastrina]|uniref:Uncharacterized protein n=1 Tax=Kickxella alabastrina TaxID=61397 RepID=A0ACC1IW37_9FUNG|nr:hypothetical protein LPJ66_000405 [Kickxella alabastrina]